MPELKSLSKKYVIIISLLFYLLSGCGPEHKEKSTSQKPNIVFILIDDLGWADLPVYGNQFHETPQISKLAEEGMRFTNAYAAAPVCSPTRASIQAGQYPARVGIIDFITGHWRPFEKVTVPKNRTQYLPQNIITVAESLKKAGYATGYFGKWHLGGSEKYLPPNQGYDTSRVYAGGGFYNPNFRPGFDEKPGGRLSEILTDFSINFMDKNRENPFFLFLSHYDVHVQLDADSALIQKYLDKKNPRYQPGNAVYAAMLEHVDRSIGRIMASLRKFGLENNTMVVFFSDNGGLATRFDDRPLIAERSLHYYQDSPLKYIATTNTPLRNEKGNVYEGGVREPLIVKWPGKIKAGAVSKAPVTSVDFYPTFLEMAGINKPENQVLDGQSLLPAFLENQYDYQRPLYWHYPVYHHGVPAGAIRKGDWKLVENQVTNEVSLYNLAIDISEHTDFKRFYPEKTEELYSLLKRWQNEVGARFPEPNPDFDPEKREEWGRHPDRN